MTHAELTVGDAKLLDVQAVGRLLDCSPRHVYRLADAGKMPPPLRLGALVRWDRHTLLQWISQGCPAVPRAGSRKRAVTP